MRNGVERRRSCLIRVARKSSSSQKRTSYAIAYAPSSRAPRKLSRAILAYTCIHPCTYICMYVLCPCSYVLLVYKLDHSWRLLFRASRSGFNSTSVGAWKTFYIYTYICICIYIPRISSLFERFSRIVVRHETCASDTRAILLSGLT